VFAQFGSDLDKVTKDKLYRGKTGREPETVKACNHAGGRPGNSALYGYQQVSYGFTGKRSQEFQQGVCEVRKQQLSGDSNEIRATGDLSSETENMLKKAAEEFKDQYLRTKR